MIVTKVLRKLGLMQGHRVGEYFFAHEREFHQVPEERHLRRLLAQFNVDCVFDVGANYGQYAQMLRKAAGFRGLIVSFEPIPDAVAALREKAKDDPNWVIEGIALSSRDGIQQFNVMSGSEFSSLSAPRHDEVDMFKEQNRVIETVNVRTETLDTAYRRLQGKYKFQRPFLKLDTQGYDVEIVRNAGPALSNFIGLQSELAVRKLYEGSVDFRDAIQAYENSGFELSAFVPNNSGHFPRMLETDCIMIRKNV